MSQQDLPNKQGRVIIRDELRIEDRIPTNLVHKDGKSSELRRTGRRWRKPVAQLGEKVWFRKTGEDGVSSFASRMIQGIFVSHHDRTGAVVCLTKHGVVRGKSWTSQTLSVAWDATN